MLSTKVGFGALAAALFITCAVIAGCGGAGTTDPEESCEWVAGTGTSGADGLVTIDMGELGTFHARVRDGLTAEPVQGVEYVCVANDCENKVSGVALGTAGYQTTVFTYNKEDVISEQGAVPSFWDDLFPWMGGESPIDGIHGVVSVPKKTWNQLRCAVAEEATDMVGDLEDGSISSVLAARLSGLVLAATYPPGSSSILLYICYCDPLDPTDTLAELQDGVYLAQGYCSTQVVRLLEMDGPCSTREDLGLALIEPVETAPGCVSGQNLSTVHGTLEDATTGAGVPNATVSVNGAGVTTDGSGVYSVSNVIPSDNVLITASASGYQPFSTVIPVAAGSDVEQDLIIVPAAVYGDQYRFVLTWGQEPRDLDSHLWVPVGADHYHVAFWDKGTLTSEPYAELDVDEMFSFGPETVTLLPEYQGEYVYAVHEWTGEGTLVTSGAQVQIFAGNTLTHVLDVPIGTCDENWWWYVGRLNAQTGEFSLVNELQSAQPIDDWRAAPTTK